MALIKNARLASDPWQLYADDAPLQPDIPAVVSLTRFQAEREELRRAGVDLGVRLEPGEHPDAIAGDLDRLSLIQLAFPVFTDGRAYSYARILRDRYGYTGELRAVGHVLRDQYLFMVRAGFDAFEVPEGETLEKWREAISAVTNAYQPAVDARQPLWALRHGRAAETTAAAAE